MSWFAAFAATGSRSCQNVHEDSAWQPKQGMHGENNRLLHAPILVAVRLHDETHIARTGG